MTEMMAGFLMMKTIVEELERRDREKGIVYRDLPHCDGCFEGCEICTPMRDSGPSIGELRRMVK